jgi:DNA-binding transcriptional regulator YhcF (GntR family)
VTVDPWSSVPPYEQLRVQVIDAVAWLDRSPPRFSSHRPRSRGCPRHRPQHGGARSYRELERDAVIETRGRLVTFIAASGDATQRQADAPRLLSPIRPIASSDPADALELSAALR